MKFQNYLKQIKELVTEMLVDMRDYTKIIFSSTPMSDLEKKLGIPSPKPAQEEILPYKKLEQVENSYKKIPFNTTYDFFKLAFSPTLISDLETRRNYREKNKLKYSWEI